MHRQDVSEMIIAAKIGLSKEWTTAALLGQMTLSQIPTDPLLYRFYELIQVYGTSIKSLIHEEFGDGIMSAIDFSMDIQREADPQGRPCQDRTQWQISALQNLLIMPHYQHKGVSGYAVHHSDAEHGAQAPEPCSPLPISDRTLPNSIE